METLSRLVLTFLLNAVWQVTVVAGVAAAGARLLRRAPASYLHVVWVLALTLGALLPLSSLPAGWDSTVPPLRDAAIVENPQRERVPSPARFLSAPLAQPGAPHGLSRFLQDLLRHRSRPITLSPFFAYTALGFFLLSLLCHLTRLGRAWRKTVHLRRAAHLRDLPERMASLVAQCRTALGLENVPILCSSQALGPAAMGFRRPVIILPEALFQASPSEELTAALCHEMAHIRRRDYLLNLVCEFIFLPVAFHPAAWLVKRRIDETRELACDEAAAGRVVSAGAYARSLVSLARAMSALTPLSPARYTLGVFDANILEERIMRLLEKRPRLGAHRAKLLLGGAALALTLVGLGACAFSFTAQEYAQAQTLTTEVSNPSVDFSGRWELDKAKSDLPSPAPDNLVQVIEQRGSELKITTTSKDWNINKPIAVTLFALMMPELSLTTDNRESVQPYGPGQMRSKSRWEDGKLITEWTLERDGQVMVTGQWVRRLSKDGKTQTLEITAHDPNRNLDGEAKVVFVKAESETMPGGPAVGVVGGVKDGVQAVKGGVIGGVIGGVPSQEGKKTVGLSGTVSDPSGARVPNALVSLYGESGSKETAVTDGAGEFSFTGLLPGDYEWKVFRDGFEVSQQKLVVSNGSLKSQQGKRDVLVLGATSMRLDIVLAPSSTMQSMVVTAPAPPEVLKKRHAAAPKRIRVGGEVEATKVLTRVPPKYPESARAKGIEGTVLLEAVISMEGVPLSLRVLESPDPELSDAAVAAVRQWLYQPMLLNGQPIEVVTTIAINFRLEG